MGMRITNTMLINNMTGYIAGNLTRMQKYQYMLANGKKIELPSDDPVVAARSLKLRTDLSEVDQYKKNVEDATSWMDTTEGALGNMGDVMQRVRELTVQGASGQTVKEDLQKINEEIKQLKNQMISIGNTTYAGRYIFSGFSTDTPLLDENGAFSTKVANDENVKFEIGIGDSININVVGGDIFNGGNAAVGAASANAVGTNDITFPLTIDATNSQLSITVDTDSPKTVNITNGTYNNIDDLVSKMQGDVDLQIGSGRVYISNIDDKLKFSSTKKGEGSLIYISPASSAAISLGVDTVTSASGSNGETGSMIDHINKLITALDAGNQEDAGKLLEKFDDDINNILRVRADVGARQNRLQLTNNRLENDTVNFTRLMSQNEDVDMAETIMQLQNEENVYKASLSGGAKIITPTLIDFLR